MRPCFHFAQQMFGRRDVTMVEVGVQFGYNAATLLREYDILAGWKILYLIEINPEYAAIIRKTLENINAPWELRIGDSAAEAAKFEDESVDVAYIDDDHSLDGARRSIAAWYPKVRVGGILGGHDQEYPGVGTAVREFVERHDYLLNISESDWWVVKQREIVNG